MPLKRAWLGLALCLSGCRNYAAFGHLFTDGTDLAMPGDGAAASNDGGISIGGETLSVPTGWTVELYRDLSGSFAYDAKDFEDAAENDSDDNRPRRLAVLSSPFSDGVVVSLGRDLLEVPSDASTGTTLHGYEPKQQDSSVSPDIDSDLDFGTNGKVPLGILVSGSSQGNGDGVWLVDQNWVMTNLDTRPNVSSVLYDRLPTLTAGVTPPVPQMYESPVSSSDPRVLRSTDGTTFTAYDSTFHVDDMEPYDSSRLVLVVENGTATPMIHLVLAASGQSPTSLTVASTHTEITLVGGAIDLFPAQVVNALYDRTQLVAVGSGGDESVLCETLAGGWSWMHAIVDPSSSQASYLVLEWQPGTSNARILRITPS